MSEYTKTTEWLSSIVCDLYLAQLVKNLPANTQGLMGNICLYLIGWAEKLLCDCELI